MLKDVVGSIISFVLVFIMLAVTPLYYIGIIQWARSETQALSSTRDLIDEVIDTRELRDDTLADYNLELASLSGYYVSTIDRQVKVINPDPMVPSSTYTTYVSVEQKKSYQQGDVIEVTVKAVGNNLFQTIARSLMGLSIPQDGFKLSGKVR